MIDLMKEAIESDSLALALKVNDLTQNLATSSENYTSSNSNFGSVTLKVPGADVSRLPKTINSSRFFYRKCKNLKAT